MIEAIIDFQVDGVSEDVPERIKSVLVGDDALRYPERQDLFQMELQFQLGEPGAAPASRNVAMGFQYRHPERPQVVQVRKNGFAFMQQRPYPKEGWSNWAPEAKRLWERYLEVVQPSAVTRVAVRYINQIRLPSHEFRIEDYFTVYPTISEDFAHLATWLVQTQMRIHGMSDRQMLQLTQGTVENPDHPTGSTVLLDLDVAHVENQPASTDVWQVVERLYSFMRPTFEFCITPSTRALFR